MTLDNTVFCTRPQNVTCKDIFWDNVRVLNIEIQRILTKIIFKIPNKQLEEDVCAEKGITYSSKEG
jgi:hypothetical protein